MSAYIQFFIRNNDTFLPIGTFSRATEIYSQFDDYVPWEHIRSLNYELLHKVRENVKDDIARCEQSIKEIREDIDHIMGCNNPLDEKMEQIGSMREWTKEIEEHLDGLRYVEYYTYFFSNILEEAEYSGFGESESIDIDKYLYAGIEIGYPTVEDIVGE